MLSRASVRSSVTLPPSVFSRSPSRTVTMRVASSLLRPGTTTAAHSHPGPEVFYVVDGEQCVETPEFGKRLGSGQSYVLAPGVNHRGLVPYRSSGGVEGLLKAPPAEVEEARRAIENVLAEAGFAAPSATSIRKPSWQGEEAAQR